MSEQTALREPDVQVPSTSDPVVLIEGQVLLPFVTDAVMSACAVSGSVNVTPPLVVCRLTGSLPLDDNSMLTPPLVVLANLMESGGR